jgi:acylphosphatase
MTTGPTTRQVFYCGRVQGVGFRFNARYIAQRFDVKGYVRNLPDGRVELVAAGKSAELDRFLDAVAESMSGNILEATSCNFTTAEQFAAFEIRT